MTSIVTSSRWGALTNITENHRMAPIKKGVLAKTVAIAHYTFGKWTSQGSNLQPLGYEPRALTIWAKGPKTQQ